MDTEKIEKNNFLVQNDQFVTKGVEIFRKHISVILKGLYWEKFNKYICYREIIRN